MANKDKKDNGGEQETKMVVKGGKVTEQQKGNSNREVHQSTGDQVIRD